MLSIALHRQCNDIPLGKAASDRALAESVAEYHKQRRYRKQQGEILRDLEVLAMTERQMYELDNRKDQVMTMIKVVLVNLVMWMHDPWVPADYAHATW